MASRKKPAFANPQAPKGMRALQDKRADGALELEVGQSVSVKLHGATQASRQFEGRRYRTVVVIDAMDSNHKAGDVVFLNGSAKFESLGVMDLRPGVEIQIQRLEDADTGKGNPMKDYAVFVPDDADLPF